MTNSNSVSASLVKNAQFELDAALGPKAPGGLSKGDDGRQEFQKFVAGTFFGTMLKELRKTQEKPAYLHGGQAEEFFQSQLDQTISDDLAKKHGAVFSEPLFSAFQRR